MSEHYKGAILNPRAYKLKNGSGWTARVCIAIVADSEVIDKLFNLSGAFQTEEIALSKALELGKRKIDDALKSQEINSVFEHESRLPSTHRHGLGHRFDDTATSIDGEAVKVPGPKNPRDNFD